MTGRTTAPSGPPRVLVIVQNLPVPLDRRVWLECKTLRQAGYDVTVVCPTGAGTETERVVDGVRILPYPGYAPGSNAFGYVLEYAYSFLATARLTVRARRAGRFDVMQACNPPEIFWPLARWLRRRDGTRFVFDHHDLSPELYRSRFDIGSRWIHRVLHTGLLALERETFRAAERVISTNASYAEVAVGRGRKHPEHVVVVRTGPDPAVMRRVQPSPELRRGRPHLVAYLGVMGPQDGVDIVIRAADLIVHSMGRRDISFTLMGAGDSHAGLVSLRDRLGLQDFVDLPGRVPDDFVTAVLSTADVGLSPDPLNPLNDVSTMNKTMEYMAFGLPVVAFDLKETRVSAADAARYVEPTVVEAYAKAIVDLVDDETGRTEMGRRGRDRVERELAWEHQQAAYLAVFDELTGRRGAADGPGATSRPEMVVDLRDAVPPAEVPAAGMAGAET